MKLYYIIDTTLVLILYHDTIHVIILYHRYDSCNKKKKLYLKNLNIKNKNNKISQGRGCNYIVMDMTHVIILYHRYDL